MPLTNCSGVLMSTGEIKVKAFLALCVNDHGWSKSARMKYLFWVFKYV